MAAVGLGIALLALLEPDVAAWRQLLYIGGLVVVTATVAVALLRGRRWIAGPAAFGLGVVGTAVGIGLAGPHLAKGGALRPTIAGSLALAAGLVLLIGSVVRLARGIGGWWQVGITLAALVVAIPVVSSVAIAVAATNVPRTALGRQTPVDLGFDYRDVEFPATDGVRLSGWFIPGTNGVGVVLLHGAGSTRSGVLDHAAVLARNGYGVLLFDARGHGRSAGQAMDFGWHGDQDVGGAVSFLAAQPEVTTIAAVGMSMGGEEAIGAAAADHRIGAVVAEGVTNRVAGDKAWLPDEYGIRGQLQRPLDWLTYGAADLLTDAEPPITLRAAAAATSAPMLLIAAGDVTDEADAAGYIAAGSPGTVTVWDVPDSGHTGALRTHPGAWEDRVTAFLAAALDVPG
jgi:dienelactone hydrolase